MDKGISNNPDSNTYNRDYLQDTTLTDDEKIDIAAKYILEKHKAAFLELSK